MTWPERLVAGGRRRTADRVSVHARLHAVGLHPSQPASWWGLCALLSRHQLSHGALQPTSALWAELLPFLLIDDERLAARALSEYLRYLDDPGAVDLEWLGLRVHEAMSVVERWNPDIGSLLDEPAAAFNARWMALLSYESLLSLRRAVSLYSSDRALAARHSFWHGTDRSTGLRRSRPVPLRRCQPLQPEHKKQ
jgi:hypothetical protein